MRPRLASAAAALIVLVAFPTPVIAADPGGAGASPGGVAAIDEPTAITCDPGPPPEPAPSGITAGAARSLLRITGRPLVAGRHVSVDTDVATGGCLTLTLYPRDARRLDAGTQIGTLTRVVADAGLTRTVVRLNARGRRLVKARRGVKAMLITDFRSAPEVSGAEVTISTPVWL